MHKENLIFIVVGRLGRNLVYSKILPVVYCGLFSKIYVFSETKGIDMDGVSYITIPKYIRNIKPIFFKKLIRIVFEPLQLTYYARLLNPSIIHGYYTIPKGINSFIAAKFSRSKCIISVIGGKVEIETAFVLKRFSKPINIALLKRADYITTKGKNDNHYLQVNGINSSKISVFNGSIDIGKFNYNGEEKDIDILFAGNFTICKGPHRAIEIIKLISEQKSDLKVFFLGNGNLFIKVKSLADTYKLDITFTGQVSNPEDYYKRSKILIFPSSNEGLSTAMLEAMSCRCVPITSNVGNQTEAAINGYNSIVIPKFDDLLSFSEHAIKLLNDVSYLTYLSKNAEDTVIKKYSVEVQSDVCKQFYAELITR